MSVPPSHTTVSPPPHERSGCMTALAIVAGLVMLLPGLCALILAGMDPKEMARDASWALLLVTLIAIGAGGVALIWWAIRRPR
jgi:drug/metabolite transporter (DMT)-like permease